ncbi:sulfatase [Haloferula sp.]|uniref:sulfatase family protein n=1 Tax=Haloferula sp. TaxID=2497595 RepID=UPI00329CC894
MRIPIALLALTSALTMQSLFAETARPNFIFVLTDDQRYDAVGVVQREQGEQARFPWFETPHMDRLAREGVRFRNAFVTSSLCAPSRAAFLTGVYNHLNGIVYNNIPFPDDSVTWASLLREKGYRTGYVGKWHMGNQSGHRPGFDHSASFDGQGKYGNQTFLVDGTSTPTKGWVDDVATDFAIEFIRENKEKPFALQLSFKSPHGPCKPPSRLKKRYEGEYCRPAANEDFHPPYDMSDTTEPPYKMGEVDRRLNRFRCIQGADDNLGRLLDALDELKIADNTMVVYASDNGYYMGDHGLKDKRTAYEESMRIPLLVRFPQMARKGAVEDAAVLNIDLAPTILDYAGVKAPEEMQGSSWRPLLADGDSSGWRESFFYEYFERAGNAPTIYALRTPKYKLVTYPGKPEWNQIFNLETDPYETKNLADNPELMQRLKKELERESKAVRFRVPDVVKQADRK